MTYDFYQDWASARNFLNGGPIYADISLTIERYLGWRLPENWPAQYWRKNYRPPPAVILTLPLAWLDYSRAFLLWSLMSLAALVATFARLARQLNAKPSIDWWLALARCRRVAGWDGARVADVDGFVVPVLCRAGPVHLTVVVDRARFRAFGRATAVTPRCG